MPMSRASSRVSSGSRSICCMDRPSRLMREICGAWRFRNPAPMAIIRNWLMVFRQCPAPFGRHVEGVGTGTEDVMVTMASARMWYPSRGGARVASPDNRSAWR